MLWSRRLAVLGIGCALMMSACARDTTPREDQAADGAPARQATEPARVQSVTGFRTPEAVLYDAGDDLYFVSNINGAPTDRSNDGFLTRMSAEGVVDSLMFVAGGRGGVTLNAPKGMALVGDTIWVADIDVVRGFHRRTGAPVATIQFRPAPIFLNDITVGEDGDLYVTDTGIRIVNGEVQHPGPNRIYRVSGRQVSVAAEGSVLDGPNGIIWDRANQRFLIVSFMAGGVLEWRPNEQPRVIASGPGGLDGVVLMNDGRALVSSWADSSLHVLVNDSLHRTITGLPSPAALGIDSRRNRVAIPLFMDDRVEIWQLN